VHESFELNERCMHREHRRVLRAGVGVS